MSERSGEDRPYVPRWKGFDAERTRRAQATADHAREHPAARGEDANAEWYEEGPHEAARRLGWSEEELGEDIEEIARRKRAR